MMIKSKMRHAHKQNRKAKFKTIRRNMKFQTTIMRLWKLKQLMVSTFTFIRPNAAILKACTLSILQKYYKFDAHYSITNYAQLQFSDAKSAISNSLYQHFSDSI